MRAALVALLMLLSGPAYAGGCLYVSQQGQSIRWSGDVTLTWDPAYTDAVNCSLTPIENSNGYTAFCGTWKTSFMPVASTSTSRDVDIIIFGFVAYWLKCINGV